MSTATATANRRTVRYSTLDEFAEDAKQLAAGNYTTVGDWTFGQILLHIGQGLHCSIDGFPIKGSWFVRTFIAPFIRNSLLVKPMKAGFKLPKSAKVLLPDPDVTTAAGLEKALSGVERLHTEIPMAVHPMLGALASEEWMRLHLRHAELHMSFVVPVGGDLNE
jgi:hypothetical protein